MPSRFIQVDHDPWARNPNLRRVELDYLQEPTTPDYRGVPTENLQRYYPDSRPEYVTGFPGQPGGSSQAESDIFAHELQGMTPVERSIQFQPSYGETEVPRGLPSPYLKPIGDTRGKDPLDYSDQFNTVLTPKQEKDYQKWLKTLPPQQRSTYDYDMRGAFKANAGQSENNHFPDTFKKPNHPSFSDQSVYHGADGQQGGSWAKDDQGKWSFTPGPANLEMHGPDRLRDYFQRSDPDVNVNLPAKSQSQALPFDPWDSGRSLAPTDIAPLTDVSQGIRDYARDVVTGEVARRGLEYYNQHPGEAALALSGGGLSVKGAGPNVIPLSRPRTYEAAQGDARSAIAEPRGYALDIGSRGAEMAPFGDVPAHTMSQPRPQPGPPPRPGEPQALPEGTVLKPLEPTNTNAPTYPVAGGYRLMPAFTKKDQWSIIDPRGEIMFRSPDKGTAQTVFDYVNKGTTGLAVGGGALAVGDQAYAGQPFNTTLPDPITEQDRFDIATHRMKPPDVPPSRPQDWSIPGVELQGGWSRDTMSGKPQPPNIDLRYRHNMPIGPQSQAAPSENYMKAVGVAPMPYPKDVQDFYDMVRADDKYRYEEVHDDPFNRPPQYVPVQYNPYAVAMEDIQPQGIPTASWSFGDTQAPPLVEPSRFPGFSDIDALNYYRPMSNLNGVPTYGG
jgi:hypothetical protein